MPPVTGYVETTYGPRYGRSSVVVLSGSAIAGDDIVVTPEVVIQTPDGTLGQGDVATLTLSMAGSGRAGVCAVDIGLACATDHIAIRSVEINPAFSLVFEESGSRLPGPLYHTVRAQPLRTLDRRLATDGLEVPLATVEVEVLSAELFASALKVDVRVVTIGRNSARTLVRPADDVAPRPGGITILLGNTRDDPGPRWTVEPASLLLEVWPVNGRAPVARLTAGTEYELHYVAGADLLTGYALFAVGPSDGRCLVAATPAPHRLFWRWSGCPLPGARSCCWPCRSAHWPSCPNPLGRPTPYG